MKEKYLLDTSVYCQPIKKIPLDMVKKRWQAIGDKFLNISIIAEIEVLQELELKNSVCLWASYREILENRLPIIPIDLAVGQKYSKLAVKSQLEGKPKSQFDLLIAATAITHNLILATCNFKDFSDIEGLRVENWNE